MIAWLPSPSLTAPIYSLPLPFLSPFASYPRQVQSWSEPVFPRLVCCNANLFTVHSSTANRQLPATLLLRSFLVLPLEPLVSFVFKALSRLVCSTQSIYCSLVTANRMSHSTLHSNLPIFATHLPVIYGKHALFEPLLRPRFLIFILPPSLLNSLPLYSLTRSRAPYSSRARSHPFPGAIDSPQLITHSTSSIGEISSDTRYRPACSTNLRPLM